MTAAHAEHRALALCRGKSPDAKFEDGHGCVFADLSHNTQLLELTLNLVELAAR
jgi:hypothetical protein